MACCEVGTVITKEETWDKVMIIVYHTAHNEGCLTLTIYLSTLGSAR
jgi:hypothetical protein